MGVVSATVLYNAYNFIEFLCIQIDPNLVRSFMIALFPFTGVFPTTVQDVTGNVNSDVWFMPCTGDNAQNIVSRICAVLFIYDKVEFWF